MVINVIIYRELIEIYKFIIYNINILRIVSKRFSCFYESTIIVRRQINIKNNGLK